MGRRAHVDHHRCIPLALVCGHKNLRNVVRDRAMQNRFSSSLTIIIKDKQITLALWLYIVISWVFNLNTWKNYEFR